MELFKQNFPKSYAKIRFRTPRASASSPCRRKAPSASSASAIQYAVANKRKSLTLVHKGNIQKFTEGAFRNWGYQLAESELRPTSTRGAMGKDQGGPRREGRERRDGCCPQGRQGHRERCNRGHRPAAGADALGMNST